MGDIFTDKPMLKIFKSVYDAINAKFDAIKASLDKADTSMQGSADITHVRAVKITLNGSAFSPVRFTADTAASVTSTNDETYDLTSVGNGGTIIATPDGGAAQTATINFAAGNSVSGDSPSTNISAETDTKFNISVDGDAAEEVTLDLAAAGGLDSGAKIATEMQTKIRALGGNKALVTVTYDSVVAGKYAIVSGTLGTGSSVVITPAANGSITEELKIGAAAGGTETAGTGDVVNAAEATAEEIAAVCNTDMAGITADGSSGSLILTSDTAGKDSKIVIGNGSLNNVIGLTNANEYYGSHGLGYDTGMADANYIVLAVLSGAAVIADKGLNVKDKTASGFVVQCETTAATDDVELIIVGIGV